MWNFYVLCVDGGACVFLGMWRSAWMEGKANGWMDVS